MLTVWFGLYGKEGMQRGAEENGGRGEEITLDEMGDFRRLFDGT